MSVPLQEISREWEIYRLLQPLTSVFVIGPKKRLNIAPSYRGLQRFNCTPRSWEDKRSCALATSVIGAVQIPGKERCSIMLGKALHGMMPVPQLRKYCERLKSWHLYFLSILFKIHWKKLKSFHWFEQALDHVFLHTYDTCVVFSSAVCSDFPAWLNFLLVLQPVCAAGPVSRAERRSTDSLCAATQPQRARVPERWPGIWHCPEDSLWGAGDREWLLQVWRVQGIFSFEATEQGVVAGNNSDCNSPCQWGKENKVFKIR